MRRSARRERPVWPLILIIILFAVFAATGFLLYLNERRVNAEPKVCYVSMSEEATARAYVWLSEIHGMELDYSEVKELMGEFSLEICLTPTEERGVYTRELAEGAYEYCENQAKQGLEKAYRQVVAKRLADAGYEGQCNAEMLDGLMQEAYGVTVAEYLAGCKIKLIPSLEELQREYSGEVAYE